MAGSYYHLLNGGWPMIENMNDARDCVEELLWLVERGIGRVEANRLLDDEFYPMERTEIAEDDARRVVREAMDVSPDEIDPDDDEEEEDDDYDSWMDDEDEEDDEDDY